MQRITITENISLAYRLGAEGFSAPQNSSLFGANKGHEVRGQNLRITTEWKSQGGSDEVLKLKAANKNILKSWDHSFLNDKPEFKQASAVTLENLAQVIWNQLSGEGLLSLQIEQGNWVIEKSQELAAQNLRVKYLTRFQSLLKAKEYIPLDLKLRLCWQGELKEQFGLVWPWSLLKQQISAVAIELKNADPQLFALAEVEVFLAEVAKLFSKAAVPQNENPILKSAPRLESLKFTDPKDHWAVSFDLAKEFAN